MDEDGVRGRSRGDAPMKPLSEAEARLVLQALEKSVALEELLQQHTYNRIKRLISTGRGRQACQKTCSSGAMAPVISITEEH